MTTARPTAQQLRRAILREVDNLPEQEQKVLAKVILISVALSEESAPQVARRTVRLPNGSGSGFFQSTVQYTAKEEKTLRYLIQGRVPDASSFLDELPQEQHLTAAQAALEIRGLGPFQLTCLQLLYEHGLRGDHLRTLNADHFKLNIYLWLDYKLNTLNMSASQAIAEINALTPAQVNDANFVPPRNNDNSAAARPSRP